MVMQKPPNPANEAERVRALHNLLVLDSAPEGCFDIITCYCRHRFGVERALISMVDTDRQWFESVCRIDAKQTLRTW